MKWRFLCCGAFSLAKRITVVAQEPKGGDWGSEEESVPRPEAENGWGDRVVAPPRWPEVVHATLVGNRGGQLSLSEVYFDSKRARHVTISTDQLKGFRLFVDERGDNNNNTAYIYDGSGEACSAVPLHCGILQPDWLAGASYVGARDLNGFQVDCWQQGRAPPPAAAAGSGSQKGAPAQPFLTYCAKKTDGREPVRMVLFDGASFDFLRWEPGVQWRPPPPSHSSSSLLPTSAGKAPPSPPSSSSRATALPPSCFLDVNLGLLPWGVTSTGAAAAVESAAKGGQGGTIVTTMRNERLVLGSVAAAVEYQRRMLLDPRLKKRKTRTRTVKLNSKPPPRKSKPGERDRRGRK